MADNNKENRMSIDDFDFAHEDANDDTSMLVNYLVTRLHQAMGNPALQGEVQQQFHAYGILPPIQQERGPERFQGETSKRRLFTEKGVENPYQELKQLLEGKPSSKKKGHAQHERSPSREREENMKTPPQKRTLPIEVSSTSLHSSSSKRPKSGASLSSKDTFVAIDKSNASRKAQYPKQTRFCFTRHDLHEECGLSLEGKLYQNLSDEDVIDEDWLAVFTKKREKGVRIFLNMVWPEYEEECRLLFHKVYQAIPTKKEIMHKFSTLFVYERCPAAMQSTTGQRKVAWDIFGEQVLDHCKKLPGEMDKKLKNWTDCNENGQHVIGTTQSTPKALLEGMTSISYSLGPQLLLNCSSINLQIVAKVEQMLAARKSTLESVKSTLNAAQVQLQEKHQSMWKIEGTSSTAAVLQGQLTELQSMKDSMERGACGASSFEVMLIDAKIIALSSALVALGADARNSKIRDDVDRIEKELIELAASEATCAAQVTFCESLLDQVKRVAVSSDMPYVATLPSEVPNLKVDPTSDAHTIDTDMHSDDQSTPGGRESSSLASDKTLREEGSHVAIDKTPAVEVEPSQQIVGKPQPKEEPMEMLMLR
ncbi:hypothetical protein L7F22_002378 [Adiantum nelumboides]|nr:hypothetical protein [Adiantum nelumboides]